MPRKNLRFTLRTPITNKELKNENARIGKYEIKDPIILKIIECARKQNHEELQRIPNLDINKVAYNTELSATAILACNKEIEAIKFLKPYGVNKDSIVYGFAMGGHDKHVKELLNQGASKDMAVVGAAQGGQKELLEWLISQGASKDLAVIGAAYDGYKELIEWLVSQGASKDVAVEGAANGGQKEIVEWLISQGASKVEAAKGAAQGGQKELVEWLISQGASKDRAIARAAYGGQKELVEWLMSQGASKDKAIRGAAYSGQKELVEWLMSQGANKGIAVIGAITGQRYKLATDIINNHQVLLPSAIDTTTSNQLKSCFNIRYNTYSFISGITSYDLQINYIKFISKIICMDDTKLARNFGALETIMYQQKLSIQDSYVYYVEDKYIRNGILTPLGNYVASFYNSYTSDKLTIMGETQEMIIPNEILNKIAYYYMAHPKLKHNDTLNTQIYPSFSESMGAKVVNLWVDRINEIRSKREILNSDSIGM
ncbi:ankyrin repeat domain-containing protein [Holosporaceae bacterium 'Namur']|nr:ankyrin repeat domain-containing protein [Holosporaceae bacterium 'Namur']